MESVDFCRTQRVRKVNVEAMLEVTNLTADFVQLSDCHVDWVSPGGLEGVVGIFRDTGGEGAWKPTKTS